MKIQSNLNIQRVMSGYGVKANRVDKTDNVAKTSDKIEISDGAKDFQVAMKAFKELPEVRSEKVQKIKDMVNSGTYSVSGKEVADKILEDAKINKLG